MSNQLIKDLEKTKARFNRRGYRFEADVIGQAIDKLKEQHEALGYVYRDMRLRADVDEDGGKVVNMGYGCWLGVCKALGKV